jgi:hypothetical protein
MKIFGIIQITQIITIIRIIVCFQGCYEGTIEGLGSSVCHGSIRDRSKTIAYQTSDNTTNAPLLMPCCLIMTRSNQ